MSEDGEVTGSSSDEGDSVKKAKLDVAGGTGEQPASAKAAKKMRNSLKRKMKKNSKKETHHEKRKESIQLLPQSTATLSQKQVLVLRDLVRISKQEHCEAIPRTLKTEQFRQLVSSIATGTPAVLNEIDGLDTVKEHRIVVVWLSMVSAEFFDSSKTAFKQIKSLTPHVQFSIVHPGSARFVKLGLEAFLMTSEVEKAVTPRATKDSPPLKRSHCILTHTECIDNGYPLPLEISPSTDPPNDMSSYWNIVEWPSNEITLSADSDLPMFAVDCEMVETAEGIALARISVIDESLQCILDTFVKPDLPVLDYKTKYSGIDEESLSAVTTTLADVKDKLISLLPSQCILIGHSLENDLHAIKLIHPYVVDTSLLFTHKATPFSKLSLRNITKKLLDWDIQCDPNGHNSVEDATACMKLMQLKLQKGLSCTLWWNEGGCRSLLGVMRQAGHDTGFIDKQGVVGFYIKDCTHPRKVTTDSECVTVAQTVIPECQFTFLQLHAMESFLKSPLKGDREKMLAVSEELDSHVMELVAGCPKKSLVFVVCGSSDIAEVKRLQQLDVPDLRRLKAAVTLARSGKVLAFLVE